LREKPARFAYTISMHRLYLSRMTRSVAFWGLLLSVFAPARGAEQNGSDQPIPALTNILQLCQLMNRDERRVCSFRFEGVVCAAHPETGLLVLQDDSGAALMEIDYQRRPVQSGQRVLLQGANCGVIRTGRGLKIGSGLVVNNDGNHPMAEKSGVVYLTAGRRPIEVAWFNGTSSFGLRIDFAGPGLPRARIPDSALFRPNPDSPAKNAVLVPGLVYRCFEGSNWDCLPDFKKLAPVKTGIVSNFDLTVITRPENVGLEFTGWFDAPRDGLYTFFVTSDDGCKLFLDEPAPQFTVIGSAPPPQPRRIAAGQSLSEDEVSQWSEVEGRVTFWEKSSGEAELELSSGAGSMRLQIIDVSGDPPPRLFHSRIRATGVCEATRTEDGQKLAGALLVPAWREIQALEPAPELWPDPGIPRIGNLARTNLSDDAEAIAPEDLHRESDFNEPSQPLPVLTTAEQVQRLRRDEATRGYPVKIRGVLPWVSGDYRAVVLQDSTRAIYVKGFPACSRDLPRVGEYWEIEGVSDPADFSPIVQATKAERLGIGRLPEPLRPTWDQLLNGSLDAQYVELQGIVTAVAAGRLTLLTRGGELNIEITSNHPESLNAYENALVRVRGCLFAKWNGMTHQVRVEPVVIIGNASITVDEPAPSDPFAAARKSAAELLFFDAQAGAFQRVRVSGQIVHAREEVYYMMDGTNGLRFIPKDPVHFQPGDWVEVVGFPELGGPSPVLHEAIARRIGRAALPEAIKLVPGELLHDYYDSTLVRVEGVLLHAGENPSGQVLEVQSGLRTFVARLHSIRRLNHSLAVGSRLVLTGVYAGQGGSRLEGRGVDSFELLLNSPADVQVLARPPWWTLGRVLVIVGLLLGVLAIALVWITLLHRQVEKRSAQLQREIRQRERAERQRAVEQERSRIARDLHDDLGSSLTEIGMLASSRPGSKMKPDEAHDRLGLIAGKSRCIINALDELVWAVNPQNDTLSSLAKYLASYVEEYLSASNLVCRVQIPQSFPRQIVPAEVRHHLFLAVKEALSNVVRHASASEIVFRLAISEDQLQIFISDNGRGFDPASPSVGNGHSNLAERMRNLNGHCEVSSSPGQGATVSLTLPLSLETVPL
jgi:signal transduction histidine kinase